MLQLELSSGRGRTRALSFPQKGDQSILSGGKIWPFIGSAAAKMVLFNGFMSLEQHDINLVRVAAACINKVLEDAQDRACALAAPFR